MMISVAKTDGKVSVKEDRLVVEAATEATLYLTIKSNFEGYDKMPIDSQVQIEAECNKILSAASNKGYEVLRESHIKDYVNLYNRVSFNLVGKNREELPTDERIHNYEKDHSDLVLVTRLFDYGRYLTIASSREGTQASNLQGIFSW